LKRTVQGASHPVRLTRGLCVLLFFCVLAASAQDASWETRIEDDGLLVETSDVEGSQVKAFRAQIVVPATPEDVAVRLRDIDSYPDWFPDTVEARSVGRENGAWVNYVRTSAPWPVKDRDAIYVSRLERLPDRLRISVEADPDLLPEKPDAVRVVEASGGWELEAAGGGTRVTWRFHLEPGGNVPAGLANARVLSTPREALLALRHYFRTRPAAATDH